MSIAPAAPRTAPHIRPAPDSAPRRPRLTVIPGRDTGPAKAPFALLIVTLLAGGLVTLLMLNTALAEDAFALQDLQQRKAELADQEQALRQELAQLSSPEQLANRADELGMVPGGTPRFIDPRTGEVLGVPEGDPPAGTGADDARSRVAPPVGR